jgi:uncharacterized protein
VTAQDDIDRLLAGKQMDVCELVEDEVLLSLPIATVHVRCGGEKPGSGGKRSSPFAELAKFKGIH